MIGSGIFSVPGLIGPTLGNTFNVMLAWMLGAVLALCGAFIVAEIASLRPQAGSTYHAVHQTMGSGVGYLYGMVSIVVGYIASLAVIALIAAGYVRYLFPDIDERIVATVIMLVPAGVHACRTIGGARLNDVMVVLKLGIVALFIVAGFWVDLEPLAAPADSPLAPAPLSLVVGAAVISINFAYLGWSSINQVAGEVRRPQRNLPRAVVASVGVVTVVYLLMNLVYMRAFEPGAMINADGTPMIDIGAATAARIFGPTGGTLVSIAIIVLLLSTITTMLFTGSRLLLAMAWKGEVPSPLGRCNAHGAPTCAVTVYALIAIGLVWLAPVGKLLEFAGLLTTFCAALTGVAVLLLRRRVRERPFSMPLHPLPAVVYLSLSAWLLYSSLMESLMVALASAGTVLAILLLRPLLTRPLGTAA
jgi:APA family basic amino acid/polyamine antiporter